MRSVKYLYSLAAVFSCLLALPAQADRMYDLMKEKEELLQQRQKLLLEHDRLVQQQIGQQTQTPAPAPASQVSIPPQ